jgi:hypothetical protein
MNPGLRQAWAPEALRAEFFWRDIRINPVGGAAGLGAEKKSALPTVKPEFVTTFATPSVELALQLPKVPATSVAGVSATESLPPLLPANEARAADSQVTEQRPPPTTQVWNVPEMAERVYRLLERRLVVERERRGVFRT